MMIGLKMCALVLMTAGGFGLVFVWSEIAWNAARRLSALPQSSSSSQDARSGYPWQGDE